MTQEKITPNHMDIYWHDYADRTPDAPVTEASMIEKSTLVGRIGLMLLGCGTGAWRVRSAMNTVAQKLGLTCTANIGLMSIDYSCFDGDRSFSHSLSLNNTGVNTCKLDRLERFVKEFDQKAGAMTTDQLHSHLDEIDRIGNQYTPAQLGLASALACGAFTFLLGGGIIEILCAFIGAGVGNYLRCKLLRKHYTLFLCIVSSVALACLAYTLSLRAAEAVFSLSVQHEAGYICAMLFIIPGFPFITSGIDLAKLDMRSGIERLVYALMIIVVATVTAWILALALNLKPEEFVALSLPAGLLLCSAAAGQLLRGLRVLHHVQQPAAHGGDGGADRRGGQHPAAGAGGSYGPPALGGGIPGIPCSRPDRFPSYEEAGISADLHHRAVYCDHGAGTLPLPGGIQPGRNVPDPVGFLAGFRPSHHPGAAAGTDLRQDHHRPVFPALYLRGGQPFKNAVDVI